MVFTVSIRRQSSRRRPRSSLPAVRLMFSECRWRLLPSSSLHPSPEVVTPGRVPSPPARASGLEGLAAACLRLICRLLVSDASAAAEPSWPALPGLGGTSIFQLEGWATPVAVSACLSCLSRLMAWCVSLLRPVGTPHPTPGSTDHPRPAHLPRGGQPFLPSASP